MKEYDYIKREIKNLLDADRYIHSLGVEKEAVKLGERYGVDIEKCKTAALIHDCQKNLKDKDLIEKALFYRINIDKIQIKSPQLLHGPVGALYSKEKFEIDDEDILNAVYYHTTGRDNMSMLEKIIYIADIIEENRNYFKGLDEIRNQAYIDINKALIMSADSTITYILQRKNLIHPLTIEFRNSLILEVESYEKKEKKSF
ncbi:putative HD superfamily hydrolase of NAD metabolism [Caloramator quimbayensis]|uniref:bis(5'-nucleosyl)-tetraphosphatase (symmetrical) n=1 Tax=Caloramator quimbayensis TaxID=1147123 RepID=A0A1T4XYQ7_9CLOT|nr:bis(5'-nucleosyl)-tetraphosphatase (symmetrical) YqeK [Caloramator quimbayensis]SKA94646.1 putative HD superfamily hydrolase of NAD metabolism [Caloramator quimbayensis]